MSSCAPRRVLRIFSSDSIYRCVAWQALRAIWTGKYYAPSFFASDEIYTETLLSVRDPDGDLRYATSLHPAEKVLVTRLHERIRKYKERG